MNPYVIKKPVITEKTMALANTDNVYTFLVTTHANKNVIKEAIEKLFGVEVESVNTIMSQPETKRTGKKRMAVTTAKKKKALIKVKDGQTIDLFDVSE